MRWGSRFGALALALVVGAACGAPEEKPAPPPAAAATPAPAAPAATPVPAAPPPPAATAPGARDAVQGEATYQQLCASCHGPRGAGDGPAGQALEPKPARHDDGAYMNALSNEHLFRVIKEGGAAVGKSPAMAPWGGTLDDARIWDVVAFVRSLAEPPYTGPAP
jgi:mono/diheme cytochrome c family protein